MSLCVCGLRMDSCVSWSNVLVQRIHILPLSITPGASLHLETGPSTTTMPSSSLTTHCHGGAHSKRSQTSTEEYAGTVWSHVGATTMPLDDTSATLSINYQYWSRHFADRPHRNWSPNPTRFGASESVIEERISHRSLFGGRNEMMSEGVGSDGSEDASEEELVDIRVAISLFTCTPRVFVVLRPSSSSSFQHVGKPEQTVRGHGQQADDEEPVVCHPSTFIEPSTLSTPSVSTTFTPSTPIFPFMSWTRSIRSLCTLHSTKMETCMISAQRHSMPCQRRKWSSLRLYCLARNNSFLVDAGSSNDGNGIMHTPFSSSWKRLRQSR